MYYPAGATTYNLGSSISSTVTTILLSSFLEPVTNTPYTMALLNTDIVFATISPKTTSSEFISFTGITQNANGSATLTGVVRGLAKKYPFTTDVAYKLPHSGQSQFILSDAPQVFVEYAAKINDETITGQWTFTNTPIVPGVVSDASTTVKGVSKTSVAPATANNPITVGTNDPRVPVAYAVDSVGTDSYAITPSPVITAYAAGQMFTFKVGTANTGAASLNVNALGAKTIKKAVTTDLATGDFLVNQIVTVIYDGTNMQLQSIPSTIPSTTLYTNGLTSKAMSDASTTQTIAHGLGIVPKRVRFSTTASTLTNQALNVSSGSYDASGQNGIWGAVSGTSATASSSGGYALQLSYSTSAPGTSGQLGSIVVDATNITITWTKAGAPSSGNAQILWECEG